MSRVVALVADPNQRRNRIPSNAELSTLRGLHARNSRLIEFLDTQLAEVDDNHGRIEARHRDILKELESIESELWASDRVKELLRIQRSDVVLGNKRIEGLIHPIRRCPEDILLMIFQSTVATSSDISGADPSATRHRKPFNLAHVCQSWRSLALNSGSLWTYIEITTNDSVIYTEKLMRHAALRLRSTPPCIVLHVETNDALEEERTDVFAFMAACQLDRFEKIASLRLYSSAELLASFVPAVINYSGELEILTIGLETSGYVPIGISGLAEGFPTTKGLEITGYNHEIRRASTSFNCIRLLDLYDIELTFNSLYASVLHSLEHLVLVECEFLGDGELGEVRLPKLRRLDIFEVTDFPWLKMTTPRLDTLTISRDSWGASTAFPPESYLTSTPTLRHLITAGPLDDGFMEAIAGRFPWLESLTIEVDRPMTTTLSPISFPKHSRLILKTQEPSMLTLEGFESVYSSCCLARSTRDGGRMVGVHLTIVVPLTQIEALKTTSWRSSQLMNFCSSTAKAMVERNGQQRIALEMVWDEQV